MFYLSRSVSRRLPNVGGQAVNTFVRAKATTASATPSAIADEKPIKELEDVEGPGWWWIPRLAGDLVHENDKLYNEFGRDQGVARVRSSLGVECINVFDLEDVKFIYQNEGKDFGGAMELWSINKYFTELDGDHPDNLALNIFHSTPRAMITRKLLNPGINSSAVAKYEGLVQDAARASVNFVNQYKDDLALWTDRTAFDMFCSLSLGTNFKTVDPNCQSDMREIVDLDDAALGIAMRLQHLPKFTHPWRGPEKVAASFDRIHEITKGHVDDLFSKTEVPVCYFKDLRDEQGLTPRQITGVFTVLLSAAIATTRTVMQWLIIASVEHPHVQVKLREEILDLLQDGTYSTSVKMPYMEAFFREVYRFYPPIAGVGIRTLQQDVVLPSSRVRVPAGTPMNLCPIHVARDQKQIPDAQEFKPERYLRENIRSRKGCPMGSKLDSAVTKDFFGSGSRSCLGRRAANLELRSILCKLLHDYELVLDPPHQSTPKRKTMTTLIPDPFPKIKLVPVSK